MRYGLEKLGAKICSWSKMLQVWGISMISDSPIETLMSFLEHQCVSNILTSSLTLARTPGSRAASWATGPHILKNIQVCLIMLYSAAVVVFDLLSLLLCF